MDIVAAIRGVDDYEKNRNYWKYLKNKLKKEGSQVVSGTTQLKIVAPDGKSKKKRIRYLTVRYSMKLKLVQ